MNLDILSFLSRRTPKVSDIKNGRCGHLRYHEDHRYADAYYELSGAPEYDLLVWVNDMRTWSDGTQITKEEMATIHNAYKEWAIKHNIKCEW